MTWLEIHAVNLTHQALTAPRARAKARCSLPNERTAPPRRAPGQDRDQARSTHRDQSGPGEAHPRTRTPRRLRAWCLNRALLGWLAALQETFRYLKNV